MNELSPQAAVVAVAQAWKAEHPPPPAAPAVEGGAEGASAPSPALAAEERLQALGADEAADMFITYLNVAVQMVARVKAPGTEHLWALTDAERKELHRPTVRVAELYLPDVKLHPLTALALTGAGIYGAKFAAIQMLEPSSAESQTGDTNHGDGKNAGTDAPGKPSTERAA